MADVSSFTIAATTLGAAALLKVTAFTVAVAMLGSTTAADAGSRARACTSAPQSKWLPVETLRFKVETLGYRVQQVRLKSITTCGELGVTDQNGAQLVLLVDPTSGDILGRL